MKNPWILVLGLTLAVSTPCYSDCRPDGTHQHGKRVYVCSDQSAARNLAGSRDDVIIVTSGATVASTVQRSAVTSAEVTALAIDSGRGRDEITNSGTVAASADLTIVANSNPTQSGKRSRDDLIGTAAATGIATGSSTCAGDSVVNSGTVEAAAASDVIRDRILFDNTPDPRRNLRAWRPRSYRKGKGYPHESRKLCGEHRCRQPRRRSVDKCWRH